MANETPKPTPRDTFLRTVAVLGLVAVLLLGAWGIITLAVNLPGIFGSIGGGISSLKPSNTPSLSVSVSPTSVNSGQSLMVSWTGKNLNGQYSYALSYSCANGVSMKAPVPTGAYQAVSCNTSFNYVNATEHMTLMPSLSSGSSAQTTITVTATNLSTGAIAATGTTSVTVRSASSNTSSNPSTPAKTSTPSYSTPSSNYYPAASKATSLYGYPDLAVIINSVVPNGSRENVTFTIINVGTNVARSGWTFNAVLPVNGSYTFSSAPQQALNPGDKVVYTLGFDRPAQGSFNYNTQPYQNYIYPTNTNSSYTCNNYGPCNVPGYLNLYPYGSPYQNQYYGSNGYCEPGYACSVPLSQYNSNQYNTNGYYGSGSSVTITADPYNLLQESNKANNTASAPAY